MQDRLKILSTLQGLTYLLLSISLIMIIGSIWFYTKPPNKSLQEENTPLTWIPRSIESDLPEGDRGKMIKYGHDIITNTSKFIGPSAARGKSFAGNNLSCNNCHLDAGKKIASGSFIGVYNRFPQFRGRENKIGTLEERINGCLERSMNGIPMPENTYEMQAIISYIEWLSEKVPEEIEKKYKGYRKINIPQRKADTLKGKIVFIAHCKVCHGEKGEGKRNELTSDPIYIYPPIAGFDSYNDGAGMNRVITAAEFIKYNMPFGVDHENPILSDEEAYDVAAYINSLPRPEKKFKENDFPDKKLKPVSTPYGPWTDTFPAIQHKYGPFQPIIVYYEQKFKIKKTK
ncbi:c-type cytochrome [Mangrovivirga sp. M17]|uniref:C-type cytochrome n=1 Tax=Mangrovivirga halotolerans TaxID=2993936 RepID=A0ABT3RNU8_9BACT|nr:c-type cytochrome [Mangrovivirga halotolerans]MCX2743281.1 c-type cytochrome [Mangrovivirga halotolerans]